MRIAVASEGLAVSPYFGHCASFTCYRIERGIIVECQNMPNPHQTPARIAAVLRELDVTAVITGIIERLCCQFGNPIGGGLCAFPPPERLAGLSPEDLAPLRSGFRARYLIDAARQVTGGTVDLAALSALPTAEARAELMKIVGVGKKVADCALLFGFGHGDCFPVDVWIGRALAELLPEGLPPSLAPCAGIAQQMIFHYMRACPDRAAAKAGEC